MLNSRPQTEGELSAYVQAYFEAQGLCVHGEVAMFKKSLFVDHVAHTGPCECPDRVIAIEMKMGASLGLLKQLQSLDTFHVACELWGVVVSAPQPATLLRWERHGDASRWLKPGLLQWQDGVLVPLVHPEVHDKKGLERRKKSLLLVDENRQVVAGLPSGHVEYATHFKLLRCWWEAWVAQQETPFVLNVNELSLPPYALQYKKVRSVLQAFLKEMQEHGRVKVVGRQGRARLWQRIDT
jgi:hypothetical protein